MHFEFCREESSDGGKDGAQDDADYQRKQHPQGKGHSGEVKDQPEDRAGIDALVHDNGCHSHAHAHHTSNGQVSTCQ